MQNPLTKIFRMAFMIASKHDGPMRISAVMLTGVCLQEVQGLLMEKMQ
jgi:hypothetical protein